MKALKLMVLALVATVAMPLAMTSCKKEEAPAEKKTPAAKTEKTAEHPKGEHPKGEHPKTEEKTSEHPEHPK